MKSLIKFALLSVAAALTFNVLFWTLIAASVWDFGPIKTAALMPFLFISEVRPSETLFIYFIVLWVVSIAQAAVLCVPAPTVSAQGGGGRIWPRVLSAAFMVGVAFAVPVMSLMDAFVSKGDAYEVGIYAGLGVWILSWLIWTPVILHRSHSEADWIERLVSKSVKGTSVGLVLSVPWFFVLRRKESCYCGFSTYWALIVGLWSLLVLGGPLLLFLSRERRLRATLR